YPDLELHQDPDVRTVSCCLLHHRDSESRRLDLHQYEPHYGCGAFLSRATSAQAGAAGVEPASSELETDLLPLDPRPCASEHDQGIGGESNPPLRLSQSRVPHRYTTDTISNSGR